MKYALIFNTITDYMAFLLQLVPYYPWILMYFLVVLRRHQFLAEVLWILAQLHLFIVLL